MAREEAKERDPRGRRRLRRRCARRRGTEGMRWFCGYLLKNNLAQVDAVRAWHGGRYADRGHTERLIVVGDAIDDVQLRNLAFQAQMETVEEGAADLDVGIKILQPLHEPRGLAVPVLAHMRLRRAHPRRRGARARVAPLRLQRRDPEALRRSRSRAACCTCSGWCARWRSRALATGDRGGNPSNGDRSMKICQVEGTLVATARIAGLQNRRLLVVKERGSSGKQVAVDPVGCKPGDWVIAVGSSAARDAAGSKDYPSDLTIVGHHRLLGRGGRPAEENGRCKSIASSVTSSRRKRNFWLAAKSLRVVEDAARQPRSGARPDRRQARRLRHHDRHFGRAHRRRQPEHHDRSDDRRHHRSLGRGALAKLTRSR